MVSRPSILKAVYKSAINALLIISRLLPLSYNLYYWAKISIRPTALFLVIRLLLLSCNNGNFSADTQELKLS